MGEWMGAIDAAARLLERSLIALDDARAAGAPGHMLDQMRAERDHCSRTMLEVCTEAIQDARDSGLDVPVELIDALDRLAHPAWPHLPATTGDLP